MIEQHLMDAVDRAEKLLIETRDTVTKICRTIADDMEDRHGFIASWHIKEAFKVKHGMAMAKYREQRVGLKNSDVVKEANAEDKAPVIALAKRLLENTAFNVGEVSRLCGLRHGALSGIFKRFGLPAPKHYRKANRKQISIYTQQKATRKRVHVNGGMRLRQNARGDVTAWLPMAHMLSHSAVLSVSVTGLSFTLSQINNDRIDTERVAIKDTLLVTTGFATELADTYSESITLGIPDRFTCVKASYDVVAKVLALEFEGRHASNIEFTALITTTDM